MVATLFTPEHGAQPGHALDQLALHAVPGRPVVVAPDQVVRRVLLLQHAAWVCVAVAVALAVAVPGGAGVGGVPQVGRDRAATTGPPLQSTKLWFGIIDGQDSARLIKAYPRAFE